MRKELELMETIEKYLKGNLSGADKIAFEKRINTDSELKKEVELQKQLLKGIERTGLKQSAKQAGKKYQFNKNLKNWGLTGFAIAVIALSSVFVYNSPSKSNHKENAAYNLPALNEQGEKLWSDADKYLPLQNFELNNEKDTVVETADGIVFAIPANCFLDANGKPVKGSIQLEVKEALKAGDIMKAGLNTRSGDKLLETGGMFYLNARQDDASLKIDPKNTVYAEIPTNEVKPGMQLFEGKRLANGTIDWVNPKPIQKDLIPVDILSLNFYPPNYLDSLKSWGYNNKDKKFTDSLYYSFAALFGYEDAARIKATQDSIAAVAEMYAAKTAAEMQAASDRGASKKEMAAIEKKYDNLYATTSQDSGEKIFRQNCAVCHSLGKNVITGPGLEGVASRVPNDLWMMKWIKNNKAVLASGDAYAKKIFAQNAGKDMTVFSDLSDDDVNAVINYIKNTHSENILLEQFGDTDIGIYGINPAKIKAIWNEKFQNTLLATREFEERLPYIHKTCDEQILDLYINNLDKNLCTIDSMVAYLNMGENHSSAGNTCSHPEFLKFAERGDGKVKNGNTNVRLLKAYYEQKAKLFTEAITKTQREFHEKQYNADAKAAQKTEEYSENNAKRLNENFEKELDLNLNNAYQQLGMKRPTASGLTSLANPIPPAVYGTPVSSTGWCNIDRCVTENTMARTTIDFTDKETGKKAVIKYEPLSISINNYKNYDRVLVYLLPDELNSFMRVENKNEKFEEKLDGLMIYKMVCIAYKGEESFYFSQDNVKPGSLAVSLIKTTNADIQNNVNKLSNHNQVKAMNDELNYFAFEKEEAKRQVEVAKINELTNKVRPVIFPCMAYASDTIAAPTQAVKGAKK